MKDVNNCKPNDVVDLAITLPVAIKIDTVLVCLSLCSRRRAPCKTPLLSFLVWRTDALRCPIMLACDSCRRRLDVISNPANMIELAFTPSENIWGARYFGEPLFRRQKSSIWRLQFPGRQCLPSKLT